jgi:hypothetical protein
MLSFSTLVLLSVMQLDGSATVVVDLPPASTSCPDDAAGGGKGHGIGSGTNATGTQAGEIASAALTVRGTEYAPGDALEFQVVLTNVSSTPLTIPVLPRSAVCESIRQNDRDLSQLRIALRFRRGSSQYGVLDAASLWGMPSNKDSYRVLEPGQKALIRVSRVWRSPQSSDGPLNELRLFVHIEGIGARPIESSNDVSVRVRPSAPGR